MTYNVNGQLIPGCASESGWLALKASAAQAEGVEVCVGCGSERTRWAEFSDRQPHGEYVTSEGWYCEDCGALEEERGVRNDLEQALRLIEAEEAWNERGLPKLDIRHLEALAEHAAELAVELDVTRRALYSVTAQVRAAMAPAAVAIEEVAA